MTNLPNGPVTTLPGHVRKSDGNDGLCEECQEKDCTVVMQGETDSFGCEYIYLCDDCYHVMQSSSEDYTTTCEWCGAEAVCKPTRDFDEGMAGPVYQVCEACREAQCRQAEEELDSV